MKFAFIILHFSTLGTLDPAVQSIGDLCSKANQVFANVSLHPTDRKTEQTERSSPEDWCTKEEEEKKLTYYAESMSYDQYVHIVRLLAKTYLVGEFENWNRCESLLPCVRSLYQKRYLFRPATDLSAAWGKVLTNTAWYLWRRGYNHEAQHLIFEALMLRERVFGSENELTLVTLKTAAGILSSQRKFEEAECINRIALQRFESSLGQRHPSTLTSVSNLALLLYYKGKYDEAEILGRRALRGSKQILGKRHIDTLKSAGNLALILQRQGKLKEATKYGKQALHGFHVTLGVDHPLTLTSVDNMAVLLEWGGQR